MQFDIITIFPSMFDSYFSYSILKRAQEKKLIQIKVHNLRDYANDKHKTVDDTPYGGGAGMVMKVEPIYKIIQNLKEEANQTKKKTRIILFSAKGKQYNQKEAEKLSKYDQLILICGRYEGVDERVSQYIAEEEIAIGEYVLTGGEIPAMVLVDSVSRLIPNVLGNEESSKNESHKEENYLEYPQYTKPENFLNWKVPPVLLSGNHQAINKWREEESHNYEK